MKKKIWKRSLLSGALVALILAAGVTLWPAQSVEGIQGASCTTTSGPFTTASAAAVDVDCMWAHKKAKQTARSYINCGSDYICESFPVYGTCTQLGPGQYRATAYWVYECGVFLP